MKLKAILEERAQILADLETLQTGAETRSFSDEEQTSWDNKMRRMAELDSLIARDAAYNAVRNYNVEQERTGTEDVQKEARAAFVKLIARGESSLSSEERQLIRRGEPIDGVAGTYLVPTTMNDRIEVAIKQFGAMWAVADVQYVGNGRDKTLPAVNDTDNKATIVSAYGQSSQSKTSFAGIALKKHTYRTPITPISYELLQDAEYDVEALIAALLAEQIFRGTNEHFTVGTGVDEPKGIALCTVGVDAAKESISSDNLIDLVGSVDAAYWPTASFMMHQNTLSSLSKLKDSTGAYILKTMENGLSRSLMGYPVVINNDMPAIGAGKVSIVFGNIKKYQIECVKNIQIQIYRELLAEYMAIGIQGFVRAGGVLVDAGTHPVKSLKHAAA